MCALPSRGAAKQVEENLLQEIEVHFKMQHENVLQLHGISVHGQSLTIVTELMYKALGVLMDDDVRFDRKTEASITKGIAEGLKYLHNNSVVHGDLKPMNVLLSKNRKQVKICDFGLSRFKKNVVATKTKTVQGTFMYMAPEMIDTVLSLRCGYEGDVWALGATVCEVVAQNDFWEVDIAADSILESISERMQNKMTPHGLVKLKEVDKVFYEMVARLCCYDKDERGSLDEVIDTCQLIISEETTKAEKKSRKKNKA